MNSLKNPQRKLRQTTCPINAKYVVLNNGVFVRGCKSRMIHADEAIALLKPNKAIGENLYVNVFNH